MASIAPLKICSMCRQNLTHNKVCDDCAPKHEQQKKDRMVRYYRKRGKTTARGYGNDWAKVRDRKLSSQPLCEICQGNGRTTAATVVHHIKPTDTHFHLRLQFSNLQSLCRNCHENLHGRRGINKKRQEVCNHRLPQIKTLKGVMN